MSDPYYSTPAWLRLRQACLRRDGYRCSTPGCGSTCRLTVDHIVARRAGGADALHNLRTLCITCDASVRERAGGQRRQGGAAPRAKGCHIDGTPRDSAHWWRAKELLGAEGPDRAKEARKVSFIVGSDFG